MPPKAKKASDYDGSPHTASHGGAGRGGERVDVHITPSPAVASADQRRRNSDDGRARSQTSPRSPSEATPPPRRPTPRQSPSTRDRGSRSPSPRDRTPQPEPEPQPYHPGQDAYLSPLARHGSLATVKRGVAWQDLGAPAQRGAQLLGWTPQSWDAESQEPLNQHWGDLSEEKCEAATSLGFSVKDFRHEATSEAFWAAIGDTVQSGEVGWSVVNNALNPELEEEEKVQLAGTGLEHKSWHREQPLFEQFQACLQKLDRFEKTCAKVSAFAPKGTDEDFQQMMDAASDRERQAAEILLELTNERVGLLQNAREELEKLSQRRDAIVDRWCSASNEDDIARNEDDITRPMRPDALVSRRDMEVKLGAFQDPQSGFRDARDGESVFGEKLNARVTRINVLKRQAMEMYDQAFLRGGGVLAKEAAAIIKQGEAEQKDLWQDLVEAGLVAKQLRITARDFMASQYQRAAGTPWKGKAIGDCDSMDDQQMRCRVRPECLDAWRLDTRVAQDCLKIMAEEPERVLTVCGLSALLDVLEQRAAQLQHLPEKVDQRDDWGRQIEAADEQINVLSHDAWASMNRLQERWHLHDIDRKQPTSMFPPSGYYTGGARGEAAGGGARGTAAAERLQQLEPDEEAKREFQRLGALLQARRDESTRLREQLQSLEEATGENLRVGLPELGHKKFQDFTANGPQAMRARLVYPEAFYKRVEEIAKEKSMRGSITEDVFKEYYAVGLKYTDGR